MIDPEYFVKKRAELGFDRADKLAEIQVWLDEKYPGMTRAKILHQGVLRIVVTNAPVAGHLRMRQVEIIQMFALADIRIAISIGDLN
jgi:hypothetical protein